MVLQYINVPNISYSTAAEAIELTIETGHQRGLRLCATVVDLGLNLVAYGRADGMTPHSVETSRRKATTAASTGRSSGGLSSEMATALENGTGGLLTRIPGGVPFVFEGVTIGGLGVAGGPPHIDAEVAATVMEALEAKVTA